MTTIAGVTDVIFDPRRRRFKGRVFLSSSEVKTVLKVSAPGHPSWDHGTIQTALIASAQNHISKGRRHAGA